MLQRVLAKEFRKHSLSLSAEAMDLLSQRLRERFPECESQSAYLRSYVQDLLSNRRNKLPLGTIVGIESIDLFLDDLPATSQETPLQPRLTVVDIQKMPKWEYFPTKRAFERSLDRSTRSLHGLSNAKSEMFRQRYALIHQRLLRHSLFSKSATNSVAQFCLTSIDSLPGTTDTRCVLGMLSQLEDGRYFLEDLDASIAVDLTYLTKNLSDGVFTENSIVLCEGFISPGGDSFRVTNLANPPTELRSQTLRAFPNVDWLGDGIDTEPSLRSQIAVAESQHKPMSSFCIILSDVCLDSDVVCRNIRSVLVGAQQMCANSHQCLAAVILMGNFVSAENRDNPQAYKAGFAALGEIFSGKESPTLLPSSCDLIIIPGPADPSPAVDILPRPRLPKLLENEFLSTSSLSPDRVCFTSSPARFRFLSKEIVLFRDDVSSKMRRLSVFEHSSSDPDLFGRATVRTLLGQSHLSPFSAHAKPVFWNFDHVLRLYPLPHAIVVGESFAKYSVQHDDCNVCNPGSFTNEGSFAFFYPLEGTFEIFQLDT